MLLSKVQIRNVLLQVDLLCLLVILANFGKVDNYVCKFEIAMHEIFLFKRNYTLNDLLKNQACLRLRKIPSSKFSILIEVTSVAQLHH